MKRLIYSFLLLGLCAGLQAQNIHISGKVIDAESKEPLTGASVFAQNTTTGTISDKEGKFFIELRPGGYDLIFSYTGYQTTTTRVTDNNDSINIELQKQDNSMGEVVIKSSNKVFDGWEKYGSFFTDHFIGTTPFAAQCTLLNPEVLEFFYYRKTEKLKVLATEPLLISNKALGYTLRYELDSFMYYYPTEISSYRGYSFFTEDTAASRFEEREWKLNRSKVYYGSKLHFMRSYYDSTLKQEGFLIDVLDEKDTTRFYRIANPYDPDYYIADDNTSEIEIFFPTKITVSYTRQSPEKGYLAQYALPADVKMQLSYIDIMKPVTIKGNGYYYDQKNWINQGYWSWKNIADQLPFDYEPQ